MTIKETIGRIKSRGRIWDVKCFVIGATGIVTEGLEKVCKQYQEGTKKILYTKTAVLGTWHMIREVLQCET
jgi:hypothetical protein